jgi:hypothetical protein
MIRKASAAAALIVTAFGQSRTISFGLASTSIRNYMRTIDFTQPAAHATGSTLPPVARGAPPPPEPAQLGVYEQLRWDPRRNPSKGRLAARSPSRTRSSAGA